MKNSCFSNNGSHGIHIGQPGPQFAKARLECIRFHDNRAGNYFSETCKDVAGRKVEQWSLRGKTGSHVCQFCSPQSDLALLAVGKEIANIVSDQQAQEPLSRIAEDSARTPQRRPRSAPAFAGDGRGVASLPRR